MQFNARVITKDLPTHQRVHRGRRRTATNSEQIKTTWDHNGQVWLNRNSPAVFILPCSQVLDEEPGLVRICPLLSPPATWSAPTESLYFGRGSWSLKRLPRVPFSITSTPYLQQKRCHKNKNKKNVTDQQLHTFQYISIYCSLSLLCGWPCLRCLWSNNN
jgi:hypothetical protein